MYNGSIVRRCSCNVVVVTMQVAFINSFVTFLLEICDGNLKMTLGMIWTIILRFAIQDISVEGWFKIITTE